MEGAFRQRLRFYKPAWHRINRWLSPPRPPFSLDCIVDEPPHTHRALLHTAKPFPAGFSSSFSLSAFQELLLLLCCQRYKTGTHYCSKRLQKQARRGIFTQRAVAPDITKQMRKAVHAQNPQNPTNPNKQTNKQQHTVHVWMAIRYGNNSP